MNIPARESHRGYLDRLRGGPSVELLMVRDFDRFHDGRVVHIYRAFGPAGERVPAGRLRVVPDDGVTYVEVAAVPAWRGMVFAVPMPPMHTNN